MSTVKVRVLRPCVVNLFGLQERYERGQIVSLRPMQAELLVGLGDAAMVTEEAPKGRRRKAETTPPENKAETLPPENKAVVGPSEDKTPLNAEEEEGEE